MKKYALLVLVYLTFLLLISSCAKEDWSIELQDENTEQYDLNANARDSTNAIDWNKQYGDEKTGKQKK